MSPQEAHRLVGHVPPMPAHQPDRRAWIAPALAAAGIACFVMAALCSRPANGAERTYELVVLEKPTASEVQDRRRIWVLSTHSNRDACMAVLSQFKVRAQQATARCLPKED